MSTLLQDLRYGLRTLARAPGFTAIAILTLALGIGANTAIYSFIDAVLLAPLPYEGADRIMRVLEKPPGFPRNGISTLNFLDWQHDNTVFEAMAAQTGGGLTLSGEGEPEMLPISRVGTAYFDIFRVRPMLGRTFVEGEDQAGKDHVIVLSYKLWRDRFGADPKILNRSILLDGEPYTVIGVLPEASAFNREGTQAWRPLVFEPQNMTRNFHWMASYARLKDGVTLEQARANMDSIGKRIAEEFPDSNKGWGVVVEPYRDVVVGDGTRTALYVLIAATGMVLLIGCVNLANLALTRGVAREREVAVRASLGAGRGRLIRQFLTENVLLSVCGGVLGLGIGFAAMRFLLTLVPPNALPREAAVSMDGRVLLFALGISVLTGLLFGLAPALHATSPDLAGSMKDGGRGASTGGARHRVRDVLVVAEIAIAFVLLVGSGLMMRSFFRLMTVEMGFNATNVLTLSLPANPTQFADATAYNNYLHQVKDAVGAVPGVQESAFTCALPLQGVCYGMPYQIAGRTVIDRANRQAVRYKIVSHEYFHAIGMRLIKGRTLNDRDVEGAPPVLVINERLANQDFPNEDPVGKHILIQQIIPGASQLGEEIPWEVVGVVANEKLYGLNDEETTAVYVSNEQSPAYGLNMMVHAALDPLTLQKSVTAAIHGVNKNQPVTNVRTLDEVRSQTVATDRLQAGLLLTFATVALLLAAIGIYGVMSYSVAQRTHELGIRAALGASTASLRKLVLYRGLALTGVGLVIGIAGALALTRAMSALLYGIGARDPLTMVTVGALLTIVSVAACLIPARRATKVDPMIALRQD